MKKVSLGGEELTSSEADMSELSVLINLLIFLEALVSAVSCPRPPTPAPAERWGNHGQSGRHCVALSGGFLSC